MALPANGTISNPAAEGYFVDLSRTGNPVRPLQRAGGGFKEAAFLAALPQRLYIVDQLTVTAVQAALDAAEDDGGGIVQLPAGTIRAGKQINCPSNVLVQGAGMGQTIIDADGWAGTLFQAKHRGNIVLRDLTLHGSLSTQGNFLFWYTQNVLIERVESRYSKDANGRLRYSHQWTVRYCNLHHGQKLHGLGTKDYFPPDDIGNEADAIARAGNLGDYGVLWSNDFAIYSVVANDNGDHGLDLHGQDGEVAGCRLEGNVYGMKSPDTINVIHHDILVNGGLYGGRVYRSHAVAGRVPTGVYFYDMQIRNTTRGINVEDGAQIFIGYNEYSGNGNNVTISGGSMYTCPGTTEAGFAGVTVNSAMCATVSELRGTAAPGGGGTTEQGDAPYPYSEVITAIEWAAAPTVIRLADGSDTWQTTWADNDLLYGSGADGTPTTESA